MLDRLFSLIVQVLGINVVDRGTEGIWAYKKYGDGTYTAWFDAAVNLNNGTLWSGGFYYHRTRSSYTVPSFSRAVTSIEANANGDQLTWFVGYTVTNGEYQLFFVDAVAAQRENIPVRVVVKGRWK